MKRNQSYVGPKPSADNQQIQPLASAGPSEPVTIQTATQSPGEPIPTAPATQQLQVSAPIPTPAEIAALPASKRKAIFRQVAKAMANQRIIDRDQAIKLRTKLEAERDQLAVNAALRVGFKTAETNVYWGSSDYIQVSFTVLVLKGGDVAEKHRELQQVFFPPIKNESDFFAELNARSQSQVVPMIGASEAALAALGAALLDKRAPVLDV